ncbi:hypothetical protein FNV43_RR17830 [Rhamnella rubrinervis]|uniref:Thylakoid soluble phosphoprotein TSP9 n=1 Tax=Rhamnella rubrinervis TaxID=2594499 RepID=A0A8K0EA55_9ROSA|nr:hypothetical protein FNV43_RR17830 [Rhamnella rubrinervis]
MRIRHLWRARALNTSIQISITMQHSSDGSYSLGWSLVLSTNNGFSNNGFAPAATGRVFAATAAKGAGGSKEEKGLLDWILGGLQKEDQLLETDPILKKVDDKNGGTTNGGKNSVAVPSKKKGGFGGLFAKK